MSADLNGTAALITGASSGIGSAVARELAAMGVQVALLGRRRDRLEELAAALTAEGGTARVIAADVTDRAQATAAVDLVLETFGRLDILVNAAGIMLNGASLEADPDDWQRMIDLNVTGLVMVTKTALPHLLAAAASNDRGVADLVNISSIAGRVANARVAVYNATKFGVTAFSESLRQEFTRQNLRVSVIEPGAVDTELFGHQRPETQQHYEQLFTGVEKLRPEDISELIGFLVSRPRRMAINEVVVRPTDQV